MAPFPAGVVQLLAAALSDEPCDAPAGTVVPVSGDRYRVAAADAWLEVRVRPGP